MKENSIRLKNRDLSWLAFNHRVLQEAADKSVPLYERIKFLAIFSSNLDEFFRVRVAYIRALLSLKRKTAKKLDFDPEKLLKRIHKVVTLQQEEFGEIFRTQIRKELNRQGIFVVKDDELAERQKELVAEYFRRDVLPHLEPVFLSNEKEAPFLENRALYLAVKLLWRAAGVDKDQQKDHEGFQYALVEIPTVRAPRFFVLPPIDDHHYILFLDDVIRLCLPEVFPHHTILGAHAVKLSRDAELYIDDEFSGDLVEKVKKALSKRKTGVPSRFLYDANMPKKMLGLLQQVFALNEEDLVPGGRYHNFSDFFSFPSPTISSTSLTYSPIVPLVPDEMDGRSKLLETIRREDKLLYYPYHSYDPVIQFLQEAAEHPQVTSIKITLYRVAKDSEVVGQLIRAAQNGKSVTAFVEVKARFDEESNIRWAEELEKVGARVLYSFPELKVHAKLCLVTLREGERLHHYAYLGTGNFNEKAACMYSDFGFFTVDDRLTKEVAQVFDILSRSTRKGKFDHLLVAPFNMREMYEELIENEMKNAHNGKHASIIAKMNSLEDRKMIAKLYEASEAGVKISLIVRGICCLIPGIKGMSENIEVISIVDRYLEHARVYIFHNGGQDRFYLSSADWMRRNLIRRIEVAFPIYNTALQRLIRSLMDLQLNDNVKARMIDKRQSNAYRKAQGSGNVQAQNATYELLKSTSVHRLEY
jgi:polyphosphate kinase